MASCNDAARVVADAERILERISCDLPAVRTLAVMDAMCQQLSNVVDSLDVNRAEVSTALYELEHSLPEVQPSLQLHTTSRVVDSLDRSVEMKRQEATMTILHNNLEQLLSALNEKGVQLRYRMRMACSRSETQPLDGNRPTQASFVAYQTETGSSEEDGK